MDKAQRLTAARMAADRYAGIARAKVLSVIRMA
ncbi:hypothetical protein [Salmonella phage ZCSE8]|nr:hypothetical protein [Salmonella phage ZCSE8]